MTSLDLTTCDTEKVHLINKIQGQGAFVAVSSVDFRIIHVSENLTTFFEIPEPSRMMINSRLNSVLPHELFRELIEKFKTAQVLPYFFQWKSLDIYVYRIEENLLGIEFEHLVETTEVDNSSNIIKHFLSTMKGAKNVSELGLHACRAVRELTGMSRVMMYRFFPPTMYGEVIAEDKNAGAHSFAGHRFPSTDIPKPARDLYLQNQVRLIQDSYETTVDIYPGINKRGPLDMSDSRLRAVSVIHIEYLKNMGVRGSFSLAVKVDEKLWGLIACHSDQPTQITHETRALCETIANCLALSAPLLERTLEQEREIAFNSRMNSLFVNLKDAIYPMAELFKRGDELNALFNVDGFAVVADSKVSAYGMTPLTTDILKLAQWSFKRLQSKNKTLFVTDSLATLDEEWFRLKDLVSGLVVIRLSEHDESLLLLFRPEILQTIQWGGDPRKNFEQRNYKGQINPRVSFETWSEVIKHTSKVWLPHEVAGVQNVKEMIFDSLIRKNDLILELGQKLQIKS